MPKAPRTSSAAAPSATVAGPVPAPVAPAPRTFPQARAQATYLALIDGARAVFAERGYDAAQTPEIAARAGVSVGTFYRYFDDKRQILVEMMRTHLAEANARVLGELSPERIARGGERELPAIMDSAIEALFAEARRYPALDRVLQEMALRDAEVASLRDAFEATAEDALAALIEQFTTREAIPDPRAAAHVIQRAGMLIAMAEASSVPSVALPGRSRRVGERAVKRALRDMIHRYLFAGGATGSSITKQSGASSPRPTRPPWASTARRQK